ncbi:UDP-xylose and UDP-N-acetylglucosamine transporter-like isoform X2 [Tigriopus californicus]|uniref:UDP-xylose and UDP-N-acetylglucosamine transporter-like isoform X2 n=1 Tax=Tigriopus californicus TaxID=6832 RepID=UPI0027DA678E|nr:UDP-xylose and UDP-N-acetylglucosamine transporter-like isoform X2 [Tigriopus californicus]
MSAAWAIGLVLWGCCLNVISLEFLVKEDPGCGNLITFCSFLFISIEGFIFTTKCGTLGPIVPFRSWTTLVVMYFIISVTNNYALNFNISMPLHMIFRAGSLMANMVMGMVILHKRYSPMKYLSVILISLGIGLCTIMSSQNVTSKSKDSNLNHSGNATNAKHESSTIHPDEDNDHDSWDMIMWCIGLAMLTFALFMSARMGIYQEVIYKKFGKHPKEALFYSHCLPLPGFLFLSQNIYTHFMIAMNSPALSILGLVEVPRMMFYLLCNVLTQYMCISAVFTLTSECASLTVTLVVTLRKFLSLLFSIWYFQNPFTLWHWVGTLMVFSGTLLFSDVPGMIKKAREQQPDKDQSKKIQ